MRFLTCLLLLTPVWLAAQNPIVRFATNQGDIDVELFADVAPRTVNNFLAYMNKGAYNNTFFHRSVRGFVIQAGGYKWSNGVAQIANTEGAIRNEYRTSNTRGTIAMAKLPSGPDTATTEWFFNLADNSANLNGQNGGFTVFGKVRDAAGLAVMDKIGAIPVTNAGGSFDSIPLINTPSGSLQERNLVLVTTIAALSADGGGGVTPSLAIASGGLITASAFGGFASAAPGSYIEIYGTNIGATPARGWADSDFRAGNAPTVLDGVSVTIGGAPSYVNYVSPGQVNVQVSTAVAEGMANVVVTNKGQSTLPVQILIKAQAPGVLAPASFKTSSGAQFVAALRPDGSFVTNGQIAGLPERRGQPGETLIFYGTGFGPLKESAVSLGGRVAQGITNVAAKVEFKFGDKLGRINYGGLAPGLVGVYQFNVVVPEDVGSGDLPLAITVDGAPIDQTLFITMR